MPIPEPISLPGPLARTEPHTLLDLGGALDSVNWLGGVGEPPKESV